MLRMITSYNMFEMKRNRKQVKTKNNPNSIILWLYLHTMLFVLSFSGVFSKIASKQSFLSVKFCLSYLCIVIILGFYAFCWQQILKHIPLTTAFCNKAVGIIWGIFWGVLIFKETIKINMVIGAVVVIIGVIIVVKSDVPDSKNNVIEEVNIDEQ